VDAKKRFGEIAHMKRIDFIKAKLIKETSLGVWQPFPITHEANHQKAESSLTKSQILSIISLILNPFLGESERSHFRGLSSKFLQ